MEGDHTRFEYCKSRAKYRDSKQPTAVKVSFIFILCRIEPFGSGVVSENPQTGKFPIRAGDAAVPKLLKIIEKKINKFQVYTVADESKYLLVFGVPKINLSAELKKEFQKFGVLKQTTVVTNEISNTGMARKLFRIIEKFSNTDYKSLYSISTIR